MQANCPECKRRIKIRKQRRDNTCKCGYVFRHSKFFGDQVKVYLADANVFLYAINKNRHHGSYCKEILSGQYVIATTVQVLKEIRQYNPYRVKLYEIKEITEEVDELRYNSIKELSVADKSLIQCAIDHPEICGIITNDYDLKSVCPERLIITEKAFFIGRPKEFLKKKR